MSEKNESVAEVPAEGNSADFFKSSKVETAKVAAKTSWPWAATAAVALVAGIGGYAIGQNGGFEHRPANFQEMMQGGPKGQMLGGKPGHHMDGGKHGEMRGNNMPGPGMMDDDDDRGRGTDPDGDNWTGTNKTPAPTTSPTN